MCRVAAKVAGCSERMREESRRSSGMSAGDQSAVSLQGVKAVGILSRKEWTRVFSKRNDMKWLDWTMKRSWSVAGEKTEKARISRVALRVRGTGTR